MKTTLLSIFLLFSLSSIAQTLENDSVYATVYTLLGKSAPLRAKPDVDAKEIARCKSLEKVQILEYADSKYFKVTCHDITGYLHRDFLASDVEAVRIVNEYNAEHGIVDKFGYADTSQSQVSESAPSQSYSTPSGGYRSGSSHTIRTGPRGGKYYINSHGKKTYVKKH